MGGRGREEDGGRDAGGRLAIVKERRGSVFRREVEFVLAVEVEVDDAEGEEERSIVACGGGDDEGVGTAPSAEEGRRREVAEATVLIGGLGSGRDEPRGPMTAADEGPGTAAEGDGSEEEPPVA